MQDTTTEFKGFQDWSVEVTGIDWKAPKDRESAIPREPPSGRSYPMWRAPDGAAFKSRAAAWRAFEASLEDGVSPAQAGAPVHT